MRTKKADFVLIEAKTGVTRTKWWEIVRRMLGGYHFGTPCARMEADVRA